MCFLIHWYPHRKYPEWISKDWPVLGNLAEFSHCCYMECCFPGGSPGQAPEADAGLMLCHFYVLRSVSDTTLVKTLIAVTSPLLLLLLWVELAQR